jgi:hypothetical protein
VPDFSNYLAYLLSQALVRCGCAPHAPSPLTRPGCQDKPLEVRQSAGLLLKNNLRRWTELLPAVQAYVKARQSLHAAHRAPPRSHAAPPNRSACSPASAFRSDTCASPWAPPSGARLGGTEARGARMGCPKRARAAQRRGRLGRRPEGLARAGGCHRADAG